jgi:hypothetical protein
MQVCDQYLSIKLPPLSARTSFVVYGRDIAAAWWHGQFPFRSSILLLWDEPTSTSLLLKLPADALQTPGAIESLCISRTRR